MATFFTLKTRILWAGIILLLAMPFNAHAQKEGNIWYFGQNAGISFNTIPPTNLTNGAVQTTEGCASICNKYGSLLFYTEGNSVYNKTHSIMPNGSGLTGNISSSQSAIIIQNPDSASIYYIFTTASGTNGITAFSVVDTVPDAGKGAVREKNVFLNADAGEKLSATLHANGKDVWVVAHQKSNNVFYAYLVTANGVNTFPVRSFVGQNHGNLSQGYMKFSPDGKKLALAESQTQTLELFDFNPSTGRLSNAQVLASGQARPYGVEFSASGRFLYCTTTSGSGNELVQYDLTSGSLAGIISSKQVIDTFSSIVPAALQLAPDGKIYMAQVGSPYLGVINKPENTGNVCNFDRFGFLLSPQKSNWGLPSFNQRFFYIPYINFEYIQPVCSNNTLDFSATGDTAYIISCRWDFGDGTGDTGKTTTHTYTSPGIYTVINIVNVGGAKPYVDTIVKTIKTLSPPDINISKPHQNHCLAGNLFAFADSSKHQSGYGYKSSVWKFSDTTLTISDTNTVRRRYILPGLYQITLSVVSTNNCADSIIDTVRVFPQADASFITNGNHCFDKNQLAPLNQSNIDIPGLITSYLWDFGDGTTSTQPSPQKTYADTGNYKITLVAFEKNGCNDTATGSFTVLPSPKAGFTKGDVCFKDSALFKNTSVITKGNLSYLWNYGDGSIASDFEKNYLYVDTGKYSVKLIAISDSLCTDTFEKEIYIKPKPVADFSVTGNCTQNPVDFTDKSVRYTIPVKNNKWIFGDGNTANTNGNAQHIYTTQNQYLVKLVTEADNGCKDSIVKPIFINPKPTPGFSINNDEQCLKGNNFIFTNTTTFPAGNIKQYTWQADGSTQATTLNHNHVFTSPADYTIKLIAVTDSGCMDSVLKNISVFPQVKTNINLNDTALCQKGNVFTITNNSVVDGTGTINKYNWLFSDNATSTSIVPLPKTFASDGVHWVQCIMETDQGCLDTFRQNLEMYFNPAINFTAQNVCLGVEVTFDNTTPDPNSKIFKWQWDFGDGSKSSAKNPTRKYQAAGNYLVHVIATTADGCADTLEKFFPNLVSPRPTAYFEDTLLGSSGIKTMYSFTNGSTGATQYLWDFGDGTLSNDENPEKTFEEVGHFLVNLTAENQYGCRDQYSKKLFVVPDMEIVIPNAFTPNNRDDLNPVFKVEGLYLTKEFSMDIFNRWGERVFATDKVTTGWDGTYAGQASPPGMYMYVIRVMDLKNKVMVYYGSFALLR